MSKSRPYYEKNITNPEVRVIVDEFKKLSAQKDIRFTKTVTIGFTKIYRKTVIGLCHYGTDFREIDLDSTYWKNSTWMSKISLLYHELSHCYCKRDHDFGNGEKYVEPANFDVRKIVNPTKPFYSGDFCPVELAAGFLEDGCAKSIMYPVLISDNCFIKHYDYYVKEMFNRCTPY